MRKVLLLITLIGSLTAQAQELPCKAKYPETERCKERYREDADGRPHGKYIQYNSNGQVIQIGNFVHGKKEGNWKEYVEFMGLGYQYLWYINGRILATSWDGPITSLSHAQRLRKEKEAKEAEEERLKGLEKEKQARIEQQRNRETAAEKIRQEAESKKSREKQIISDWENGNRLWRSYDFISFLEEFPNSYYAKEAKSKRDESLIWEKALSSRSSEGIDEYLKKYPKGYFSSQANEYKSKWLFERARALDENLNCMSLPTNEKAIQLYKEYLREYPNGQHVAEAKNRVLLWDISSKSITSVSGIKARLAYYKANKENLCNGVDYEIAKLESMHALAVAKADPSILKNLIIPGWGNVSANKANNKIEGGLDDGYYFHAPVVATIAIVGTIGTGVYFNKEANKNYDIYLDSDDPTNWDWHYNKAKSQRNTAYILYGVGATLWTLDMVNIMSKKAGIRKQLNVYKNEQRKITTNLGIDDKSLGLKFVLNIN
ncbi:hypothetical protein [Pontibacter sp. BAB1700]|uniref:hypothetical protein n=1 Tax=Pontibacter sp. BAB1700 TaxID=1144253 RepID=UPI00026BE948|nr:hypothetical protein [Pontibacter sp. BAB1700]EJF09322.1 hypothetical protein O71_15725 [Pontibacter sp. BAB1700]